MDSESRSRTVRFAFTTLVAMLVFFAVASAKAQTFEVFYSFTGKVGAGPDGQLAIDTAGNLYGTATYGGLGQRVYGTVYKLNSTGSASLLNSFTGGADGWDPWAGVILDQKGNLYGTTKTGGITNTTCTQGCGIVYKVDSSGTETVLYAFTGGSDGWEPIHELTRDATGNLYGTTNAGGGATGGAWEIGMRNRLPAGDGWRGKDSACV
jgi:uncharacterized repeat protein (TIGR03803 family)